MHHLWLLWLQTQLKLDLKGLIFKLSLFWCYWSISIWIWGLNLIMRTRIRVRADLIKAQNFTILGKCTIIKHMSFLFILLECLVNHLSNTLEVLLLIWYALISCAIVKVTLFYFVVQNLLRELIAIFVAKTTIQPSFVSIMIRDLTTLGLVKHHTLRCYLLHLFYFL